MGSQHGCHGRDTVGVFLACLVDPPIMITALLWVQPARLLLTWMLLSLPLSMPHLQTHIRRIASFVEVELALVMYHRTG
jgi:hypothetical protein